jgi:membrane-associated protein
LKDFILAMLTQYGDVTLLISMMLGIVGLPLPDEFLLFIAGSMNAGSMLTMCVLIFFAWVGSSLGMSINFVLGRRIGLKRISRVTRWVHLSEEKLNIWAGRFEKFGAPFILIGFYVAGLRHAVPFIAGTSKMSFKKFAFFAYGGALLWISVFVCLGKYFGNQWHRISHLFHHPIWLVILAIMVIGLVKFRRIRRIVTPLQNNQTE